MIRFFVEKGVGIVVHHAMRFKHMRNYFVVMAQNISTLGWHRPQVQTNPMTVPIGSHKTEALALAAPGEIEDVRRRLTVTKRRTPRS